MTSRNALRRVFVAVVVFAAASVVPVPMVWAAPAVRLEEVPSPPRQAVSLSRQASHLGVRWVGEETDVIQLRWRAAGGGWSGWLPIEVSEDLGDDATDVRMSGLVPVEDATGVQLRVQWGDPRSMETIAIDTEHGPRRLVVAELPGAAAQGLNTGSTPSGGPPPVPQPAVVRRADWGADEAMKGHDPPAFAPVRRVSLHHTAGSEGDDPAATVRAIYAYHTKANGWNDIGYNFLVDSAGRIYEGRYARDYAPGEIPTAEDREGRGVIGAHTAGNNTGTVGVALLGDYSGDARPTSAAVAAAERLIAWKADRHDIDVAGTTMWSTGERSTLIGHRDAVATACPGDRLYDQLPGMRQRIASAVGSVKPRPTTTGYWTLARDSGLFTFGDASFLGGPGEVPTPAISIAPTPSGSGYWVLSANGRVSPYGDAVFHGSTENMRLNAPAVRLEPTTTGRGYWIQSADGGIFSFGDAAFFGSTGNLRLNAPVVSMSATPTGRGYWLLAADGGVFTFGDGEFFGSTGSMRLNAPVVSMAPHPSGRGYWLQARDGGIFTFGESVAFYGSVPGLGLKGTADTVQIRSTPTGDGYYVLAVDGGIFTFGDSRFHGAQPGLSGPRAAVDLALRTTAPS